jgi:Cytochrome c7 and related cytochrome c/Class III cytochrome C family
MRKNKSIVLVAVFQTSVMLLFVAPRIFAHQVAATPSAKQIVPDNPAAHAAPAQPISYSHKKHLALGLNCKDCHTNPDPGKLMTFPDTGRCMQCHATIAKDKPAIQKLAEYAKLKKAIPWVRVYTVLPGVAWTHRPHLEAGVNCETCHGQVREMDATAEVTSVTAMYVCLNCHQMNHAKSSCDTCHKQ